MAIVFFLIWRMSRNNYFRTGSEHNKFSVPKDDRQHMNVPFVVPDFHCCCISVSRLYIDIYFYVLQ